jgi:hypothetical protein
MTRRFAAVAILALSLVACDSTSPTASPTATGTARPTPTTRPSTAASAEPSAAVQIDDESYLAGDAFSMPSNDEGMDWLTPTSLPVMPNGRPAVRVAFLPVSCATADFVVQVDDGPPEDAWETSLHEGAGGQRSAGSWPAAQPPQCADGQGPTYLELGYHPLTLETIHLAASLLKVIDSPSKVELVPVYTSADATQPSLTMTGVVSLEPQSGPKKPRKTTPEEVVSTTFARATLPDGTAPNHWGFRLTGCGSGGPTFVDVTARIGSAEPVEVGQCSDGTYSTVEMSLPLPPEGTRIAVLAAGGTTKSFVQVGEFQWRGDRD